MATLESLFSLADERWRQKSACVGMTDVFFATGGEALKKCRSICAQCSVFEECLNWSIGNYDDAESGVFAGLTMHARERIVSGQRPWIDWRIELGVKLKRPAQPKYSQAELKIRHKAKLARERMVNERPPCPTCGGKDLNKDGKNKHGDQRWLCFPCRKRFVAAAISVAA